MNEEPSSSRRRFIKQSVAGATAAAGLGSNVQAAPNPEAVASMTPAQLRDQLVRCLGGTWPVPGPLNIERKAPEQQDGYRIQALSYEVEPGDRVPAYLLLPDDAKVGNAAPAVAVWHQHNGQYHLGKCEPAGLDGDPMHHTGVALAREGYVVLCPDALCFEDRRDPDDTLKNMWFERYEFLRYVVAGKCMAWKNILDMRRAVDVLCAQPEVDAERIGCYGHSMGSTHTWLVGPHEPRLKALVGNCCLPTYAAIHEHKILHCFPNFVPGWEPFGDTPAMAALIAPRALHLNLGERDGGSPIEHAKTGIEHIAEAYAAQGARDRFSWFIEPDTGHVLSPKMWAKTRDFFARHLKA